MIHKLTVLIIMDHHWIYGEGRYRIILHPISFTIYYLGKNKSPSWIKEWFDFKSDEILTIFINAVYRITFLEFKNRLHL